jgi:hypothetical protein
MKGLVQRADPADTKAGHQVVQHAPDIGALAENGVGTIVPRHEGYAQTAELFPEVTVNERMPVAIHPQSPHGTRPNRGQRLCGVGRAPGQDASYNQVAFSLAFNDWLTVDAWNPEVGYIAKWPTTNRVGVPRGFQTALVDASNVDRPDTSPYGSTFIVSGTSTYDLRDLFIG